MRATSKVGQAVLCALLMFRLALSMMGQQAPNSAPMAPSERPFAQAEKADAVAPAKTAGAKTDEAVPDVMDIVRRSVEHDEHNAELLAHNYTYQSREVARELDKNGQVKKTTVKTYDHVYLYGDFRERLIAEDDKPLSEKKEREEEEKLEKAKKKFENESESDRKKHLAEEEKDRLEGRKFLMEIPKAFRFTLKGTEEVNGRDAWVIDLTPRTDFKSDVKHADLLKKFHGTLWIDKAEYQWAKVDAELLDDVSFGLVLARLHKGMHAQFEQTKINDEVWLPRQFKFNGSARLALFLNPRMEIESSFDKYQRYKTETKITSVDEMEH